MYWILLVGVFVYGLCVCLFVVSCLLNYSMSLVIVSYHLASAAADWISLDLVNNITSRTTAVASCSEAVVWQFHQPHRKVVSIDQTCFLLFYVLMTTRLPDWRADELQKHSSTQQLSREVLFSSICIRNYLTDPSGRTWGASQTHIWVCGVRSRSERGGGQEGTENGNVTELNRKGRKTENKEDRELRLGSASI